jgi:hypothetical protein
MVLESLRLQRLRTKARKKTLARFQRIREFQLPAAQWIRARRGCVDRANVTWAASYFGPVLRWRAGP